MPSNFLKIPLLLLFCTIFVACSKEKTTDKIVASVKDKNLYLSELKEVLTGKINKKDSAEVTKNYIESWIKNEVFLLNTKEISPEDEKNIEKQVEAYKQSLFRYSFEKNYLKKNIKEDVTQAEINEFYSKNEDEFMLKQNIVQAYFAKIPTKSVEKENIKKLMLSDKNEDLLLLKNACIANASMFKIEDTTWVDFEELVKNSPLEQITDKTNFVRNNKFKEISDSTGTYFLKIKTFKNANQPAPLVFVEEKIKAMLIMQRRTDALRKLEEELYQKALKNKDFEIK